MQFYPDTITSRLILNWKSKVVTLKQKEIHLFSLGWKALLPNKAKSQDSDEENQNTLPKLNKADALMVHERGKFKKKSPHRPLPLRMQPC